jgi:hypothetical protein
MLRSHRVTIQPALRPDHAEGGTHPIHAALPQRPDFGTGSIIVRQAGRRAGDGKPAPALSVLY